ncbi:MAG TPA: DNA polymerase I [Longimicrobium sp.]|uniref:DNA polymerase I n=1 Tax=Longimicrobium sp. TaxID=2029185 RepID=UPI002ED98D05
MEKPEKTRERLYLIDGYALIYRAFFALISRPLVSSRGENTSAAFGVARFLIKIIDQHQPDYLGMVFDAGDSERVEMYPQYKATREKMPDELALSIPRIRQLVEAFRIPVLELQGYEADDVIGTLAKKAVDAGLEAVIVSGDKDFYQLIRPHVCLLNPGRGGPTAVEEEWVDERNAHERLGVPPRHVVDYLGLIGDSSDNVPGVSGIGPKTAIQLIEQYGSIEDIIAHTAEIRSKRAREALEAFADSARLSRRLVTIREDLAVELDADALRLREPDRGALKDLFLDLEFNTLAREFAASLPASTGEAGDGAPSAPSRLAGEYRLLSTTEEVHELVARAREAGRFAVDTETDSKDPMRATLCGISIGVVVGEAFYLPFRHRTRGPDQGELLGDDTPVVGPDGPQCAVLRNLPDLHSAEMRPLLDLLEDAAVEKVGQNLKYDYLVFRREGIDLRGIAFDTMVASYVLEPGRREHGMDSLALQHLDHKTITYEEVAGKGKAQIPFAEVELDVACTYAAEDADITLRLADKFGPEMQALELDHLFRDVELPLVHVLAEMEYNGIRIDEPFFARMSEDLRAQQSQLEREIYAEAGEEFNIGSTPQLREILFGKLGLPVIKKTKTGASTDVDVLQALAAQGHRLPTLLMQYRHVDKLRGTYVDALPLMVNPETGRIHTSFNQTVAATGRLSSTDPNLQNIPIRTEMGAEIRRGFVPAEGHVFVSADYSQIELRILAHYSEDEAFVEAFRAGADIHRQTAALIFEVPVESVTKEMRDRAKTVNFGIIYGQGPFSLAQQLGISQAEAKAFIEAYFTRFPGVRRYLDEQIELARTRGYVETLTGRRRYIPEIQSRNWNVRAFGERAATNAPIQGSSADLIKIAMIRIQNDIAAGVVPAKMLLQVHDELLFETPIGTEDAVREFVRERMEGAATLKVPLKVAGGVGHSWFETK